MLQGLLGASFILTAAPLLSSCTGIVVKDSEWCGSLGSQGAACFHTLTTTEERLSLQAWAERWDDLSNPQGPQLCTTAATFADLKAVIEKLCSDRQGMCTYDQKEQLYQLTKKMDKALELSKKANGKR